MKSYRIEVKKQVLIIIVLLMPILFSACAPFKIVKDSDINKAGVASNGDIFNADDYATKTWDDKVIKYFNQKAVESDILIKAITENPDSAAIKYGYKNIQSGGELNFIVKGKGKVINIDKSSKNGIINIDLAPYDKKSDVKIQIGSVIKETSIRDSLSSLKFDDFENQIDFAAVSNAYNKIVNDKVLKGIDFGKSVNKEIEFIGAFTFDKDNGIMITPVNIKVLEGGK